MDGHGSAKVNALLAHESQFETTMGIGGDGDTAVVERAAFRDRIEAELATTGAQHGVGEAEAFKMITEI